MGAVVSIDFRIGGADAVQAMTRSISQSLDAAAKSAVRASQQADKLQLVGARALAANQQIILKGQVARSTAAQAQMAQGAIVAAKNQTTAAVASQRAQTAIHIAESRNRVSLQKAELVAQTKTHAAAVASASAAQRQVRALEAKRERAEMTARNGAQGAFKGVLGGAVVSGVSKGVTAVTQGAKALVGGIATGAGIDASISHGVKQRMDQERMAQDLSSSGLLRGAEGPQGQRVEGSAIAAKAREVGMATAIDPTKVIEAMATMTSVSGDLAGSMATVGDLAKLSRATGSDLNDMAAAAGNVAAQLGDVSDAGQRARIVESVMRTVAAQGKLGAVEVKDMASQMAKLAARSAEFSGGNVESTMASLGALAQEARAKGGAATAGQAATSVGSFINQFSKGARRKEMAKAMGGDMSKIEDKNGNLLDPEELMVNMLNATKGDKNKMGKLIADSSAQRVSRGFQTVYNNAGGGKAGEDAVRTEFKRLKSASMGKGDVDEDFAKSMETSAAKAEIFQQRLDKMSADMAERVMPALVKLAPVAEKAAVALSDFAAWFSQNPLLGIGAVIAASVAKDVAGAGIGAAIKAMLGGGAGAGGGAGGAVMLGAAVGLGIGAVVADDLDKGLKAQESNDTGTNARAMRALGSVSGKSITEEQRTSATSMLAELDTEKANRKGFFGNAWEGATAGAKGLMNGDVTVGNLASVIPVAALGRAAVQGVVGTQQENTAGKEQDAIAASIRAALEANAAKPTTLASGQGIAITNWGDMPAQGRDPATSPITGK